MWPTISAVTVIIYGIYIMHQDILTIVVEGSAKDDNWGVAEDKGWCPVGGSAKDDNFGVTENEGRCPIDQYLQS